MWTERDPHNVLDIHRITTHTASRHWNILLLTAMMSSAHFTFGKCMWSQTKIRLTRTPLFKFPRIILKSIHNQMDHPTHTEEASNSVLPVMDLDNAVRTSILTFFGSPLTPSPTASTTLRTKPARRRDACWKILRSAVSLTYGSLWCLFTRGRASNRGHRGLCLTSSLATTLSAIAMQRWDFYKYCQTHLSSFLRIKLSKFCILGSSRFYPRLYES